MGYVTVATGFNASGEDAKLLLSTAWLFKVAAHRVLSLAKSAPVLPASKIGWKNAFRGAAYEVIPNRRYADSAVVLVMGIYESARRLGVDFRGVELGGWLMFQQSEKEYPPRNITLKAVDEAWVTAFDYGGGSRRIKLRTSASGAHRSLLEELLRERQPYNPRVAVKSWNFRGGKLYVRGELQVSIPLDFYHRCMARFRRNNGRLLGGVDVNVDRLNLAIVDEYGRLRDHRTFWYEDASRKGSPRRRAQSVVGMKIHEMLRYAYHHGVKTLFLEDPGVLGRLKLAWIRSGERLNRNYNWRVSVFRNSIVEKITLKAPLYAIKTVYIDPRGTTHSREHGELARRYGLDKHSASAYLIALRGIERSKTIQKVTV